LSSGEWNCCKCATAPVVGNEINAGEDMPLHPLQIT
jgi:hypothetical protein